MRPSLIRLLLILTVVGGIPRAAATEAQKQAQKPKPDYRGLLLFAPRPDYPYEARGARITGSGVVIMQIDTSTGKVVSCRMSPSTGNSALDAAALYAFRQWRFKAGTTFHMAQIPITFTMSGEVLTEYRVKEKPMDEALAAFLGKGTVTKGPIPAYPRSVPWVNKQGKGVYELHVQQD